MSRERSLPILRLVLVAAFVLLPVTAFTSPRQAVSLRYRGYWRALRILTVESLSVRNAADYRMEVTIRTEGLIDLLFPWRSRTESVGIVQEGWFVPRRVRSDGTFRNRTYRTTLDYLDSGEVRIEAEGLVSREHRDPVPAELRRATVDPQTATLALIARTAAGSSCAGTDRVFDGRLRYDVHFVDCGTVSVERSRGALYAGPARVCEGVIHPVAGFSRSELQGETTLRYWLAPVREGGPPVPVRLDLSGSRGTLRMYLTEAHDPDS
jgi:hypothetical protein